MSERKFIGSLVLFLVAVGIVLLPSPASAHTSSTYITKHWPTNQTVSYGVNTGYPGSDYRSRALDGKNQWNDSTNSGEPNFYWSLADDISYGDAQTPCGVPNFNTGALFWNNLDYAGTGVLGITRLCAANPIWNFTIEFDSTRSWYAGTADAPDNRADFWSVATHEFGHAFGFTGGSGGHFPAGDSICANNSSMATMCPSYYIGTERQRTVSTHDIHTLDGGY